MSDWLHNLPLFWMALVVFGGTYVAVAAIYWIVTVFAAGERARSFKAVSPGLLPPLGILFGLFVAFTAAQVGSDSQQAAATVEREASALRSVAILAAIFPADSATHLRTLIGNYIEETATHEWPIMAHRSATVRIIPQSLAEALELTLSLTPSTDGQKIAQREITTAVASALDARLQRILISRSEVNSVKWSTLFLQAVCALIAIAMVHIDNRLTSVMTMAIFATGVAASVFLILAHDRPFVGRISIGPDALLQVMPQAQAVHSQNN
jgi:Protein of unknown function (DUF4239)